jgi:hypothetical protein
MIEQKPRGLSAEQKAELWKRWKAGQSLNEIGRALGKDHVVIHFVLARHGGIAPPTRRRSRRVLTLAERKTSLAESPAVARCGSSHKVCAALPLQSAERLPAMAGARSIELAQPISRLGSGRCGLSRVS